MQQLDQKLAQEIFSEITKAQRILMHCHPNPDGDSIGSTLAMQHVLKEMGKDVTVIKGDSHLPKYLSALPGFDTIVEKNFFEINIADYELFLILDAAAPGQISRLGEIVFPEPLKTIIIDHHISNTGFAQINLIDNSYPATAQMVFDLLKAWKLPLNPQAALCLFIGMYTGTGGFRYKPTTAKTIAAASELTQLAPDFTDTLFFMENNNTKGRLQLQGMLLSSIETHFNDSVAFAGLSYAQLEEKGISNNDAAGIDVSAMLKSVVGWNIGVSFIEQEPGKVKISFRTRDAKTYDVSKVATLLGGGGHIVAAGAILAGTVEESKQKVIKALAEAYPFLPKDQNDTINIK